MRENTTRTVGIVLLAVIWLLLSVAAWLLPSREVSDAERRKLAQFPELSAATVLNGSFMTKFEDYTLDQFPLRDTFRQAKSLFHYYVLNQEDNNDIYIANGYAAKLEYPLNEASVQNAANRFNWIYDTYLSGTDSRIYFCIAPDKGYYLAEENGYPSMDYSRMFSMLTQSLPWAQHIDITDCLDIADYYRTDTHWRQESLVDAAGKLGAAMSIAIPQFTETEIDRPFYGVYYGQAALPMEPDAMYILENEVINGCTVTNQETGEITEIYNLDMLSSRDLYDIYLSGAVSLLNVDNPNATGNRELIVFRDSFGSSMIPLLIQDYKRITVVDIRYISSSQLAEAIDFHGQDVLFLYSTLVLNSSNSLK